MKGNNGLNASEKLSRREGRQAAMADDEIPEKEGTT